MVYSSPEALEVVRSFHSGREGGGYEGDLDGLQVDDERFG